MLKKNEKKRKEKKRQLIELDDKILAKLLQF